MVTDLAVNLKFAHGERVKYTSDLCLLPFENRVPSLEKLARILGTLR